MQIIKKTRRRGTRKDLNGPRTKSEEPNLIGRDAIGLKHPNPIPFPLKSGSEHRPVTKPKLFKPTLYKSYCEGSFVCKPNNSIGPQRNRVLTICIEEAFIYYFFFFIYIFCSNCIQLFNFPLMFDYISGVIILL